MFCNSTTTQSCGDAPDSLLCWSLSIFPLNSSLTWLSLGHLCKQKLRHGEPEGLLSISVRIWREMGISPKSQCSSPSTEPPPCSTLGHPCRVPNKLMTLHNSSPACRVLPLEVLWLEFRVEIFRSDYHFFILGVHKTNPRSSKPKSFSSLQGQKIPFSTSSCSLSLLKSLSRNQLGSSHVFHSLFWCPGWRGRGWNISLLLLQSVEI